MNRPRAIEPSNGHFSSRSSARFWVLIKDIPHRLGWPTLTAKRLWHKLRYIDYPGTKLVRPSSVTVSPDKDDTKSIQSAINYVSGADTKAYADYCAALEIYQAKWYRFFIRKPYWNIGGTVKLGKGEYFLGDSLNMADNVLLTGKSRRTTRLVMKGSK